jgi:hypothetical protein
MARPTGVGRAITTYAGVEAYSFTFADVVEPIRDRAGAVRRNQTLGHPLGYSVDPDRGRGRSGRWSAEGA